MAEPITDKDRAIALFEERGIAWVREQLETERFSSFKKRFAQHWVAEYDRAAQEASTRDANALAREANDIARASNDLASAANALAARANRHARNAAIAAAAAVAVSIAAIIVSALSRGG